jgi:hypothetical protein
MTNTQAELKAVTTPDGAAILDGRRGTISTLNPTGAYVWQALQRGEDAEAIALNLARETGVAADVVRHDVQLFVEALKGHDLHPDR